MQTTDYYFHHANENVTRLVPLFSNPKNDGLQSVHSLHFHYPPPPPPQKKTVSQIFDKCSVLLL